MPSDSSLKVVAGSSFNFNISKVSKLCPKKKYSDGENKSEDFFDDMIENAGGFGPHQKLLLLCLIPFAMFYAFTYFVQLFIVVRPKNYWCRVPELDHLDTKTRRNLSVPGAAEGKTWDKCHTFDVKWNEVLSTMKPPAPGTPLVECQHGWEYEHVDIPYKTITTERDWVCQKASYAPLAQMMFFVGSLAGCYIFGTMGDNIGRVPVLVATNILALTASVATVFTTGLWDFCICRFLVGTAHEDLFMMAYIIVIEFVEPEQRTLVNMISMAVFFDIGCMMLPLLALWLCNWRALVYVTSVPMIIALASPLTFPESARWLLSQGRIKAAIHVMQKLEELNKVEIKANEKYYSRLYKEDLGTLQNRETITDLLRNPTLRRVMLLMMFVFMVNAFCFDMVMHMSDNLGKDFFMIFFIAASTGIPAVIFIALYLDKWGRRMFTCGPLAMTSLLMFIASFVSRGFLLATLVILSRCCINVSYITITLWAVELLPTGMRGQGSGLIHMSGCVGTIICPPILYAERRWVNLPRLTVSVVALLACLLTLLIVDTTGWILPRNILAGEQAIKEAEEEERILRIQKAQTRQLEKKCINSCKGCVKCEMPNCPSH